MKVVVLCGGLGTRLRDETEFRPKPMIEVGGRPLLWHIMKIYAHYGFNEFVLALGYKGESIRQYFLNYEAMTRDVTVRLGAPSQVTLHGGRAVEPWTVTLADTGASALTGARVKRVERYVDGPRFMLTYGDGVADIDLGKLLAFHERHRSEEHTSELQSRLHLVCRLLLEKKKKTKKQKVTSYSKQ